MGVKGLWQYFAQMDLQDLMFDKVNRGSTLVVDGMNFMYHMMEVSGVYDDQSRLEKRQMGNYRQFRDVLVREVTRLKALGFKLEFYFDGNGSPFKALKEKKKRNKSFLSKWKKLYKALRYRFKLIRQAEYPLPQLTLFVMKQLLCHDEDITMVQCEREADLDISKRCVELRDQAVEAYVYSEDSDFAFVPGCALIRLGAFDDQRVGYQPWPFQAPVWTCTKLREVLNLVDENAVVEFALLLGCDFNGIVKHIESGDYPVPLPSRGDSVASFVKLYQFIQSRPAGYQVQPREDPNGLHSLVIKYSREFFHLVVDEEAFETSLGTILDTIREEDLIPILEAIEMSDEPEREVDDVAQRVGAVDEELSDDEMDLEDDPTKDPDNLHGNGHIAAGAEVPANAARAVSTSSIQAYNDAARAEMAAIVPTISNEIKTALKDTWQSLPESERPSLAALGSFVIQFVENNSNYQEALEMSEVQIHALRSMIEDLAADQPVETFRYALHWEDAKTAERYQILLRVLLKEFYMAEMFAPDAVPLEKLYDGLTYNYLVDKYEKDRIRAETQLAIGATDATTAVDAPDVANIEEEDCVEDDEDVEDAGVPELAVEDDLDFSAETITSLQALPVDEFADQIIETVRKSRISFLKGETGCGKSTRIPLILARAAAANPKEQCRILVCEPKKLAALALYRRVKGEIEKAGMSDSIHVAARLSSTETHGPDAAHITYSTASHVCRRYLSNTAALKKYTHIVLDEVHERTLENDLLIMALRSLLQDVGASHVRVLLLSATMDSEHFGRYFTGSIDNNAEFAAVAAAAAGAMLLRPSDIATLHVGSTRYSYALHYVYPKRLKPQRLVYSHPSDHANAADTTSIDALEVLNAEEVTDDEDEDDDEESSNASEGSSSNVRRSHPYQHLLDDQFQGWCDSIVRDCFQYAINAVPKSSMLNKQMKIAEKLITTCPVGHSVLIFLPGMSEISNLQAKFDTNPAYEVKLVFSSMTQYQEDDLLREVPADKTRIILATAIAESSVTLPSVKMVIDFGLDEIEEVDTNQYQLGGGGGGRSIKRYTWITRPSAVQRAGRAGRTSHGLVYRLYSKHLARQMSQINTCETRKQPLHELILRTLSNFGGKLGTGFTLSSVFQRLIDPPPAFHSHNHNNANHAAAMLQGALQYLHNAFLIDRTDEGTCVLSKMGAFVATLPVSTNLGRFILYGIELDFAPIAVIMAAALSRRFRPFKSTSVTYSAPDDYNDQIRRGLFSAWELDEQRYSEPMLMVSLYLKLVKARPMPPHVTEERMRAFYGLCYAISVEPARALAFLDTVEHLRLAVRAALAKPTLIFEDDQNDLNYDTESGIYIPAKRRFDNSWQALNYSSLQSSDTSILVRIALLWTSDGNIMRTNPQANKLADYHVKFDENQISSEKLESELFPHTRRGPKRYNRVTGTREPTEVPAASHRKVRILRTMVKFQVKPPVLPPQPTNNKNNSAKGKYIPPGAKAAAMKKNVTPDLSKMSLSMDASDILFRLHTRSAAKDIDVSFLWKPSSPLETSGASAHGSSSGLWDLYVSTTRPIPFQDKVTAILEGVCEKHNATAAEMHTPTVHVRNRVINLQRVSTESFPYVQYTLGSLKLWRICGLTAQSFAFTRNLWKHKIQNFVEIFQPSSVISTTDTSSIYVRTTSAGVHAYKFPSNEFRLYALLQQPVVNTNAVGAATGAVAAPAAVADNAVEVTSEFHLTSWNILQFYKPTNQYDGPRGIPADSFLPIVKDAPLGFRLLNGYGCQRFGHELQVNTRFYNPDRKKVLWHEGVEALHTRPVCDYMQGEETVLPHYATWELLDNTSLPAINHQHNHHNGNLLDNEEAFPALAAAVNTDWQHHNAHNENDNHRRLLWSRTDVDSYSYLASALPYFDYPDNIAQHPYHAHRDHTHMYAIANYVVEETRRNAQGEMETNICCDQVSVLRYPFTWIAVMMTVVAPFWTRFVSGSTTNNNNNNNNNNGAALPPGQAAPLSVYEKYQFACQEIRDIIAWSAAEGVTYNNSDLRDKVLRMHCNSLSAIENRRLFSMNDDYYPSNAQDAYGNQFNAEGTVLSLADIEWKAVTNTSSVPPSREVSGAYNAGFYALQDNVQALTDLVRQVSL